MIKTTATGHKCNGMWRNAPEEINEKNEEGGREREGEGEGEGEGESERLVYKDGR